MSEDARKIVIDQFISRDGKKLPEPHLVREIGDTRHSEGVLGTMQWLLSCDLAT